MTVIRTLRSVLFIIVMWQCIVAVLHPLPYILPTPLHVFRSLLMHRGLIAAQIPPTLLETLLGLSSGILLGIGLALSLCLFRSLDSLLRPVMLISQALPVLATAPLLVIWFGYGIPAKVITITLMLFFPVANSFLEGLKQTPQAYLDSAQLLGSTRWQTLCHIRIPAALTHLTAGIRIATATAPLSAVISEWVGSNQGLGFLLLNSNAQLQIDLMFAVLGVLTLLNMTLYFTIDKLLDRLTPWDQ
jgi:putative hydroxymethylpyrimidine transport system permease protein